MSIHLLSPVSTASVPITARATLGREWKPTSPWNGRLILPQPGQRDPEGGVYLEVHSAPESQASLRGKTVKLRLKSAPWVERATQDVDFSKETFTNIQEGNLSPTRLNGWRDVSPLESLAGARPGNDVQVALEDVTVIGDPPALLIEDEPTQISGSHKALVRFEKKLSGKRWQVRHWSSERKDFSGPVEIIENTGSNDFDPFLNSALNREGYYLFGNPKPNGQMTFQALEPRAITTLQSDRVVFGGRSTLSHLKKETWTDQAARKGQISKTELHPSPGQNFLQKGNEYLLIHTFGGKEKGEGMMGLTTGHFALGTAEVVTDEFTGQDRLDIEYHQVYAHNPQGIISGSLQWHNYMGSLEQLNSNSEARGWLYHRPVADVILDVPELQETTEGYAPMEVLRDRLSEMAGRYRNGDGDGSSIVTPAQSCSMDSAQALFAAAQDWKKDIRAGKIQHEAEQVELLRFARLISHQVTPIFGVAPSAWAKTAGDSKDPGEKRLKWLPALLSPTTVLPRDHADGLVKKALRNDHSALVVKTDVVGSTSQLEPSAPVHFFSR